MIDPETLYTLNKLYEIKSIVRKQEQKTAEANKAESLKLVVKPEELWQEIKPQVESSEFYQLMISGSPGSGKTTIARTLAHFAHDDGYHLLYSSSFDILDAPITFVEQARGAKRLYIVLDDMSYALAASSAKMQSKIKNFFSMIRHALHANIFVIVIAHFTTAVPPLFKNSNIWIFSAPTTQEYDAMVKIVGRREQLRNRLEIMFNAVTQIQKAVSVSDEIEFSAYGQDYKFHWNVDGRLALILKNGEALIYHSKDIQCEKCSYVGQNIRMDTSNYTQKKED